MSRQFRHVAVYKLYCLLGYELGRIWWRHVCACLHMSLTSGTGRDGIPVEFRDEGYMELIISRKFLLM